MRVSWDTLYIHIRFRLEEQKEIQQTRIPKI